MGCKQSTERSTEGQTGPILLDAEGQDITRAEADDPTLPPVPEGSWYRLPFTESSPMPILSLQTDLSGHVIFNSIPIPTRESEVAPYTAGGTRPPYKHSFTLGFEPIYGMGIPFSTALAIEHRWRLRVKHNASPQRFERPFYDTMIAINLFVNGEQVVDRCPHDASLSMCTATYDSHEAVTAWRLIPIPLSPTLDHPSFAVSSIFLGLMTSFLSHCCEKLTPGNHVVRVDVLYGCKSENNFFTDFICQGEMELIVNPESIANVRPLLDAVNARRMYVKEHEDRSRLLPHGVDARSLPSCPGCGSMQAYRCLTCSALVCGRASCTKLSRPDGYPHCCQLHRPAKQRLL